MASTGKIKYSKWDLTLILFLTSVTFIWAQNLSRQKISFNLYDKSGKQLTEEAISSGQVKVYSLRENNAASYPKLSYDKESKLFTFTESVISPGIALAFASGNDTMYISIFGRAGMDRIIDGITVQRGSYILTSNEFAGRKHLKVESWKNYLEDETPADNQDLSAYVEILKDKKPITLVEVPNNN